MGCRQFSHRAAEESLPLRDAFAVLFFVSVGMLFDPAVLLTDPVKVLAVTLVIMVGKTLAAIALVLLMRLPLAMGLLLVAAGLVAGIALRFLADGHAGLGADIPGLGLWRCLGGFALGAVLCRVWQVWRFGAAWAFAAGATLLAAGLALDLPEPWLVPPVLFAGLLALVLDQGPVSRLLASRALRLLGETRRLMNEHGVPRRHVPAPTTLRDALDQLAVDRESLAEALRANAGWGGAT